MVKPQRKRRADAVKTALELKDAQMFCAVLMATSRATANV